MLFLLLVCSRTRAACCEYSDINSGLSLKPGRYLKTFDSYLPVRAAKYGDTADECGEALFLCGKSLLELARLVNGLFTILGCSMYDVSDWFDTSVNDKLFISTCFQI